MWAWLAVAFAGELQTVPELDLERYAGTWYEIARYDVWYERGCEDVVATYTPQEDGTVAVLNACTIRKRSGDKHKQSRGTARRPDEAHPGRLEVSFFRPFWGDYQVMALGPDYAWALVGSPDRGSLWVLARQPTLDGPSWDAAIGVATAQGFDRSLLIRTPQSEGRP